MSYLLVCSSSDTESLDPTSPWVCGLLCIIIMLENTGLPVFVILAVQEMQLCLYFKGTVFSFKIS